MNILFRIISFLKYRLKAGNAHGLHSPFVFELYTEEISKNKHYYCFNRLEKIKKTLLNSDETLNINDLGAGKNRKKNQIQKIKHIANNSISSQLKCELLFKLVNKFQPKNIIELGTSLGISTLYLSFAKSNSTILTFEGSKEILDIAEDQFSKTNRKNITTLLGDINSTLPTELKKLETVDFVFFDANHQYLPTIEYFNWCLKKTNQETIFIFDDIYWSPEMLKAWKEIIAREEVKISIDLFHLGLVFFRNNQPKQHFTLKF